QQPSVSPGVFYQPAESTIVTTENSSSISLKEVIAKIQDSVVEVVTEEPVNSPFFEELVETGAGSGVIISKDGYIVTCSHVVMDASNLQVTLRDGSSYKAEVIGIPDDVHDIALLKIDAVDLVPAILGNSDLLEVGEDAIVIGNPLGSFGGTVTNGIISALEREVLVEGTSMVLLQTNAAVNPGNSGGGIFNGKGELIGLINAKSMGNNIEGIGFAIPINLVMPIVEQLINKGYVSTPAIGINAMYIGSRSAASEYGVERFGVYVDSLAPGKGAEQAGILPKDFILYIDGTPIDNLNDISVSLREHEVGDSIEIQVLRDKETLTFIVILGERNT
ncbi:MAG: trypsin-like peptidase domain-containing protein, partial [Oscillospiraceae bacterium]|nr:trypsin-like peptidase domain-containing protein [Oscillospiraceae bacterium]